MQTPEADGQEDRILLIVLPAVLVILCQSDTLRELHWFLGETCEILFRMCPSQAHRWWQGGADQVGVLWATAVIFCLLWGYLSHAQNFGHAKSFHTKQSEEVVGALEHRHHLCLWRFLTCKFLEAGKRSWGNRHIHVPRVPGLPDDNSSWQLVVCEPRVEMQGARLRRLRRGEQMQTSHSLVKL